MMIDPSLESVKSIYLCDGEGWRIILTFEHVYSFYVLAYEFSSATLINYCQRLINKILVNMVRQILFGALIV